MPSRARGDVPGQGESGQGALPHDDRVNEFDGDVLGIRAPSAVAERDQLAALAEPGRHGGAGTTDRIGALHEGQASFATAGKGIGYGPENDWSGPRGTDTSHGCTPKRRAQRRTIGHASGAASC